MVVLGRFTPKQIQLWLLLFSPVVSAGGGTTHFQMFCSVSRHYGWIAGLGNVVMGSLVAPCICYFNYMPGFSRRLVS